MKENNPSPNKGNNTPLYVVCYCLAIFCIVSRIYELLGRHGIWLSDISVKILLFFLAAWKVMDIIKSLYADATSEPSPPPIDTYSDKDKDIANDNEHESSRNTHSALDFLDDDLDYFNREFCCTGDFDEKLKAIFGDFSDTNHEENNIINYDEEYDELYGSPNDNISESVCNEEVPKPDNNANDKKSLYD